MNYKFGIICCVLAWLFFAVSSFIVDSGISFLLLLMGSVLMFIGIEYITPVKYCRKEDLPIHGVCEILYVINKDDDSGSIVLIKMPDGGFKLFELKQIFLTPGYFKVDHTGLLLRFPEK